MNRLTPLHMAAQMGNIHIVRLLLDHKAQATARCNMGRTPIMLAAWRNKLNVVKVLQKVCFVLPQK